MDKTYRDPLSPEPANPYKWIDGMPTEPAKKPSVSLLSIDRLTASATLLVGGARYTYTFMTLREVDTVEYLFKISALKALNYAKGHSEKVEKVS